MVSSLRARVLELGRNWAQSQYELIVRAVELDDSGEWLADGAVTSAHWLADQLDIEACTTREWLRIGRALKRLPAIDAALRDGALSFSKVRALTRYATAENEQELVELARSVPAGQLSRHLAAWLMGHDTPEQTEQRQNEAQSYRARLDPDGLTTITVRAAPLLAAQLATAVDAIVLRRAKLTARQARATGQWPSYAQQRALAFADLLNARAPLDTEVIVHVRGDGCALHDGTPISEHTVARLIGSSFIRALIHDTWRPIDATDRRRPTPRQRHVVHARFDGRCVDCGSAELIEYHHEPEYQRTRHTRVDELEPRCESCHHRLHRHHANAIARQR